MSKHIWEWDRVSREPMWVVCIRCGRRELLKLVLETVGCEGCPVEGVQEKLIKEERHGNKIHYGPG